MSRVPFGQLEEIMRTDLPCFMRRGIITERR